MSPRKCGQAAGQKHLGMIECESNKDDNDYNRQTDSGINKNQESKYMSESSNVVQSRIFRLQWHTTHLYLRSVSFRDATKTKCTLWKG